MMVCFETTWGLRIQGRGTEVKNPTVSGGREATPSPGVAWKHQLELAIPAEALIARATDPA